MSALEPPSTPTSPSSSTAPRLRRITSTEKSKQHDQSLVAAALAGPVPKLAHLLQENALPAAHVLGQAVNVVGPLYLRAFKLGTQFYNHAPLDLIQAAMGLGLCFFGGAYCASIAAAEAFNLATWSTTRSALEDIWADLCVIREAVDKDSDAQSKKHDGAPPPERTPAELAQHKLRVALLAVQDPQKLSIAVGGLWAAWLAVIGTLRLQIAKTITLGVSIAQMLDAPALRYGVPVLAHVAPPEYHHWLPVAVRTLAKLIAVALAWYLKVVIAAAQSALRGGLLCSRAVMRLSLSYGLVEPRHAEDAYARHATPRHARHATPRHATPRHATRAHTHAFIRTH